MSFLYKNKFKLLLLFIILGSSSPYLYREFQKYNEQNLYKKLIYTLQDKLESAVSSQSIHWPKQIKLGQETYHIQYSLNDDLTNYTRNLLKRYGSDFCAVVAMENETGRILTATGVQKGDHRINDRLVFTSTHPAASMFKIVTAANLLENSKIKLQSSFYYRGKGTTLYKYQLKDKKSRYRRSQTFKKAFAYSNNVIFGKAAINYTNSESLFKTALEMGFNKKLMKELPLSESILVMPKNEYQLAEIATGFNRITMISPLHAALISSIVSNKGNLISPKIVDSVVDKNDNLIWRNQKKTKRVLGEPSALKLEELMKETIWRGTARSSFLGFSRGLKEKIVLGGKTGSLTGGVPYGKRDWFTSFAYPEGKRKRGISVAVMIVNKDKWHVRSPYIANKVIKYYFSKIYPQKQSLTDNKDSKKEENSI